jgi:glycosyltransferase involved in cell wall biosynthesis
MDQIPTSQKKPGHILFVTGEYPPMVGGVGAYTAEVGAALVARGWQVSVVTSRQAEPAPSSPIQVYPMMHRWDWQLIPQIASLAKKIGADLVHVQYQAGSYFQHVAINVAPLWWRQQGIPVAWTYHDLLTPYVLPKAQWLRQWARDLPARVCDWTITTNQVDRLHLAQIAKNLACIPIGSNISAHSFHPEERRARRAMRGFREDDLVIGYFGFVTPDKGVMELMKTVTQLLPELPTLQVFMVGQIIRINSPYQRSFWERIQKYIHTQGLEPRIKSTGHQPDAEISADLNACDLLLLPYLDGANLRRGSLMAGLAQGCAIVTTTPDAPIPELVGGRDLLYVPPGDVDATVAAVRDLLRDPAQLALLCQNARAASVQFSWERIAELHEQAYWAAGKAKK